MSEKLPRWIRPSDIRVGDTIQIDTESPMLLAVRKVAPNEGGIAFSGVAEDGVELNLLHDKRARNRKYLLLRRKR